MIIVIYSDYVCILKRKNKTINSYTRALTNYARRGEIMEKLLWTILEPIKKFKTAAISPP